MNTVLIPVAFYSYSWGARTCVGDFFNLKLLRSRYLLFETEEGSEFFVTNVLRLDLVYCSKDLFLLLTFFLCLL